MSVQPIVLLYNTEEVYEGLKLNMATRGCGQGFLY